MADCLFCTILAGELPASVVYRDELACAFLDIRPVNPGHVLVIPTRHATILADMDEQSGGHLFQVAPVLLVFRQNVGCAPRRLIQRTLPGQLGIFLKVPLVKELHIVRENAETVSVMYFS